MMLLLSGASENVVVTFSLKEGSFFIDFLLMLTGELALMLDPLLFLFGDLGDLVMMGLPQQSTEISVPLSEKVRLPSI